MSAAGADQVFRETASGARADREQLRRALGQLAKGDVLMVTQLDRLARSTRDLAKSCGVSVSTISRLNPSLLSA